ncbi:MAG: histidinol-phosphate transaminase [Kiritimatiellae bacterium]|nr:histidinol-phosphate transaminase [Kiritimatiellia bacterium]MDD5520716.1 histidinol-phosphate transaminase [Kiritimatiellia bacterium]
MNTFIKLANTWIKNLGTYEPGRPIEEVARDLGFRNVNEISKLASNENALGPSPKAMNAMCKAVSGMHRYPDGNAYYLKKAIAAKLNIKAEQLLPANGSNEIIELLGHTFLGPGTGIVMADRAFVVYKLVAATFHANVISVPMKDYTHDLPAMLAAIKPETRIVFIANPNNPTSTMVDEKTLDRFMEKVPAHVVVCLDEAYIELLTVSKQPDTLKYIRQDKNVILMRTFSKTYGLAGLRIGYAIAPEACIRLLNQVRQPFNVNAMALAGAEAALKDDKYVERTQKAVKEGIQYFEQEFRRLSLSYVPAVVNFILVDVKNGRNVFEKMMREGIIVRPMDGYGLPCHIRITVGTKQENKKCIKALEKVLSR